MKRNFWFVLVAIVCLATNFIMPLFAGYNVSPVEFLVYYGGLKTGEVTLHVLDLSGKAIDIPVEIVRSGDQVLLKWKGNLPKGFLLLDPNWGEMRPTNRYSGEQIYIDLPGVARKGNDEECKKFVAVVMLLNIDDRRIFPRIKALFPAGVKVPKDFKNDVLGWNFSREYLKENAGKLLTLDIDFGKRCSLNCPHCFRRSNKVDKFNGLEMDFDAVLNILAQAKALGLKSVKFLGAGEPTEEKRIHELLVEIHKIGVISLIFTKGHVIGDNKLVKKHWGLNSGEELATELYRLNASILLGCNSFDPIIQDQMVGGIAGYTLKRNHALEILVRSGFNQDSPTRMALIAAPITKANFNEIYKMYVWARQRNIYFATCPTMVSGRCGDEKSWQEITPSRRELVDLYTKIYQYNIQNGLQTLEQIEAEGISPYAGAHPCNQVSCGMYITLNGTVLRCPGDDVTVFGSIWEESLVDIWQKSENYRRCGQFNCGCPPKLGKSIPCKFFADVMQNLQSSL